jgi:hypothetical protein
MAKGIKDYLVALSWVQSSGAHSTTGPHLVSDLGLLEYRAAAALSRDVRQPDRVLAD